MDKSKDRCGTKQFPRMLRVFLSQEFNTACALHDVDYKDKKISRADADKDFLELMLIQSKGKFHLKVKAHAYYWAVRLFGWIFY